MNFEILLKGFTLVCLFFIAFSLIVKHMLENIDNVEEDDDGFYDRRDKKK